jgi:general stress protein 26
MTDATWRPDETREIAELIKDIDICMLVTQSDGTVRGRPMSNNGKVEFDGDSWFFSFRESGKVADIEQDPRVELAYIATERGAWVSVEGRAEVVDDDAKKRELWEDDLDQWFQKGPDDDALILLKVRADRIHAWANGEELVAEPGSGVKRIAS